MERQNPAVIIQSLREHWPSRTMEWLMSLFLLSWGLYILFNPAIFTQPESAALFAGMASMVSAFTLYPALAWGGGAFAVGLARAVALFVNGAYTRTPLIRVAASFGSMFIVTQIIIGLWKSGVPNVGLVTYSILVLADIISAYRAGHDAVHAQLRRQEIRGYRRERASNSFSPAT